MANLGITVKELKEFCDQQIKQGNGDKHILISADDEGNGFHTLFYGFTSKPEDVESFLEYEHDGTHTVENAILLG